MIAASWTAAAIAADPPPTNNSDLPERVSFTRHVLPLLTRHGCGSSGCHSRSDNGYFRGSNGFQLSFAGCRPQEDHESLVRSARGRYVNPLAADRSLLLLKATHQVTHRRSDGGNTYLGKVNRVLNEQTTEQRIPVDSPSYRLLERWITEGVPGPDARDAPPHRLEVTPHELNFTAPRKDESRPQAARSLPVGVKAHWPDGEDVAQLASFEIADQAVATVDTEGRVTPAAPGRTLLRVRYCNRYVAIPIRVMAAAPADDEIPPFAPLSPLDRLASDEWQRLGIRPAKLADDRQFLRRAYLQLIGRLPSPREARQFFGSRDPDKRLALIDELTARPAFAEHWSQVWAAWLFEGTESLPVDSASAADQWLRTAMADQMPLDRLVRELLTASGDLKRHGPAAFYFHCRNSQRAAARVSSFLLGADLACARCHTHPHADFTQADFASLAACFAGIEVRPIGTESAEVRWNSNAQGQASPVARTGDGLFLKLATSEGNPRAALADWLAGDGRMVLARNLVSRYWRHFFGRGLVEGGADLRTSVEATLPEVLDRLAQDLIDHGFDARRLAGDICKSRLYQLASQTSDSQHPTLEEVDFFARFRPQRLGNLLLSRVVDQVTEAPGAFARTWAGLQREGPLWHWSGPFPPIGGSPRRECPCDKEEIPAPPVGLHLLSGSGLSEAITHPRGRVARLLNAGYSSERIIEELFLATMTRRPKPEEREKLAKHLADTLAKAGSPSAGRRQAFEDIAWALLNSRECLFID
jgi:hypothetical protein